MTPKELTVEVNRSKSLSADVQPDDAADKTVTWSSSNEAIATVTVDPSDSIKATVEAKAEGTATITVTSNNIRKTCTVTVTDYEAKSFVTSPQNTTVKVGKTATLTAQLGPDHATNKTVTWTSSDPATVSVGAPTLEDDVSSVVVTAHKVGSATITAKSADNANVVATCTVTVPEDKVTGLSMETTAKLYLKHALGQRSGVSRLHDAVSEYQSLRHDQ